MTRKIAVVTGSRAEYGVLYWLMKEIQNDSDLELQVMVTGMHLSPEFGSTYQQIEQEGFTIASKIESQLSSDTGVGAAKSVGLGIIGFVDAYQTLQPDLVVLVGDRFEILAAAQAAFFLGIPIAHIGGGEVTEGAFDDAIRHAVTKLSSMHFVTTDQYQARVIQLGEAPEHIWSFGSPAMDHLEKAALLDKVALEDALDFKFGELNFLVTYHHATLSESTPQQVMEALFQALEKFPQSRVIFTGANSDPGGWEINKIIQAYLEQYPHRGKFYTNLGMTYYLSAVKQMNAVIGNSSSGLIDVPFFSKPTVNIGDRQQGRLLASSVINCQENSQDIEQAIKKALSADFQKILKMVKTPYKKGNVAYQIKEVLKHQELGSIVIKKFNDLNFGVECGV